MRALAASLFAIAAATLAVGGILHGSPGLAIGSLLVAAVFAASLYIELADLFLDLCLVLLSAICASGFLIGIGIAFSLPTAILAILGWNAAHLFAGIDSAPLARDAVRRHVLHYLLHAVLPGALVGALVVASYAVDIQLTFGYALLLAIASFILVSIFMILAHRTRARRRGMTDEELAREERIATRYR